MKARFDVQWRLLLPLLAVLLVPLGTLHAQEDKAAALKQSLAEN